MRVRRLTMVRLAQDRWTGAMDTTNWILGTAAVGSATVGGVFFAFSGFVMPALRRLPADGGIRAMQEINRTAVTAPLMTALFGTAAVCAVAAVQALRSPGAGAGWTVAGAAAYLLGAVGVTVGANVPRNDRLASVQVASSTAASVWHDYLGGGAAWTHVRTVGCLAAAAAFAVALVRR